MEDRRPVYVSTQALGRGSLEESLAIAATAGITHVELSSGVPYCEDVRSTILPARESMQFLVHNYFPAPHAEFVLNLASNDPAVLGLSRRHCQRAIELCRDLNAPLYSVHSGFCFHATPADLGRPLIEARRIPPEEARRVFVESVVLLADYASNLGVGIAIENNVLTRSNRTNGKNDMLLGVTSDDLLDILDQVQRDNVGLLLDVGHLKVSAAALSFDPNRFIEEVSTFIRAVHLSDNDGVRDSNGVVGDESWFWKPLLDRVPGDTTWILETSKLPAESIALQVALIAARVASRSNGPG